MLRRVVLGAEHAGVEAGDVDGADRLPRGLVGDVESRRQVEDLDVEALAPEPGGDRGAEPARASRDDRLHGTRITFPVELRDSISRCASAASSNGERGADDRAHAMGAPEPEEVERSLAHHLRLDAREAAEVEALHADVPPHEQRRVELLPGAAREADRERDPERPQERDRVGQELPSDRVVDDVDGVDLREPVVRDSLGGAE